MIKSPFFPFLVFIIFQSLNFCASPINPSGGPKDTIPPILLESTPIHKTINFGDREFELIFDEKMNGDKLKTNLSITPTTEIKYSYLIKKNKVIIKFEEDFEDSTTYTFNFFNGLTDATEKNPVENLILAFSTGSYIDSLRITGEVTDLLTNQSQKNFLVGLYLYTDTLNFYTDKPRYFSTTNGDGQFTIDNIKNDKYRLLLFQDENKNALFDPSTESHGFIPGIIDLQSNIDSLHIYTQFIDVSDFKLISSRPFGRYYDIRYNKEVISYDLSPLTESDSLPASMLNEEKNTIRLFNSIDLPFESDSVGIIVTAKDTLKTALIDTVYVLFNESSRKADELIVKHTPKLDPSQEIHGLVSFSKPISTLNKDLLYIGIDSIYAIPVLADSNFQWNYNKTLLTYRISFDWQLYSDTLNHYLHQAIRDTLPENDSTFQFTPRPFNTTNIVLEQGSFISVEQDSSELISSKIKKINTSDLGVLFLNIQTDYTSFFVDVIKGKDVVRQFKNEKNITLSAMQPGTYTFKIYIDTNNDGVWLPGNIVTDTEPEPVYLYPNRTELRANWEVTIDDISF